MRYNYLMIYYLDLFGVVVFAITGSLAAGRKQMDLLGVVVLALVTALGGGTLRDVLLGAVPVFWVLDITYVVLPVMTGIVVFFYSQGRTLRHTSIRIPDAVGLAVFTVIGADVAMMHGVPWIIVTIMGMMTGVAGGMMRDVLSGEIPLVLRAEIYATASMCGALAYSALNSLLPAEKYIHLNMAAAMLVTLIIRLVAIRYKLSLPVFKSTD